MKRVIAVVTGALLLVCASACRGDEQRDDAAEAGSEDTAGAPDPASCEQITCEASEVCVQGACVGIQTEGGCVRTSSGDSCGAGEVCVEVAGKDQCVPAQTCDGPEGCTPGDLGAVCSVDVFPDRQPVCIPGRCVDDSNCPVGRNCAQAGDTLGWCSDGEFGSPCTADAHCLSASCFQASSDEPGICS